jgi:hypothetical protein
MLIYIYIHLQDLTFQDWMIHYLRGASSMQFNKLGDELRKLTCKTQPKSVHYCQGWEQMAERNFNFWESKEVFRKQKCNIGQTVKTVSTKDVFQPVCSSTQVTGQVPFLLLEFEAAAKEAASISSSYHHYDPMHWIELPANIQNAMGTLGYDQHTWDDTNICPDAFQKEWVDDGC